MRILLGLSFLLAVLTSQGHADEFLFGPYDAFQAGRDAAVRRDVKHRQAIQLQLQTIDEMKWYSGFAATGLGAYYGRPFPDLDSIYAYGRWSVQDRASRPQDYGYVFQPWPYVPGDIWGYRWDVAVRQPIGRREIQTSPNRWESHPIYADERPAIPPSAGPADPLPEFSSPAAPPPKPTFPREF